MNKKVNIELIEVEKKVSNGGRSYARFKTNMGWMSAFDKPIIKFLENKIGERVNVLIAIDEDKGFKNIRKILKSNQNELEDEDEEADEEGEEEMEEAEKLEVKTEKIQTPAKNPQATMWASYAKDLFIEIHNYQRSKEINNGVGGETEKAIMEKAITLIKQARDAFE
jgi:CO dehydrogenase/acetyl-CoA synthase beta subunit